MTQTRNAPQQDTKHLITSALPYVSGVKHLGNIAGSLLPPDVYAQYLRQIGQDVLFICATDDHGTPTELAAKKADMPYVAFTEQQHTLQKDVYTGFNLRFDHFGRTSRPENIQLTQEFGRVLFEKGLAEIRSIEQFYSPTDQRFLPDRYIEGTCPHCSYPKARGDQCENCTKVLDPTDLLTPRSAISGSTNLEIRTTQHLFLKLSTLQDDVRAWVNTRQEWSPLVKSIAHKWLDEGLQDRCITRDLDWGVPVTGIPGLEGKVYYVWFDAPIGYIGATAEHTPHWRDWWYDSEATVKYTQFMGKDNVPFHSISFPATLLGVDAKWKQVDVIKGFNWLTYYGGKFSTSQQRGVFTDRALAILPADYWRYYLLARSPESDDSNFTWEDFQAVVNKDLADVLGNFINRVTSFAHKKFGPTVPAAGPLTSTDTTFIHTVNTLLQDYATAISAMEIRKTVFAFRSLCAAGNEYLATCEPWAVYKTDPARAGAILHLALQLQRVLAVIGNPLIPHTARILATHLNCLPDLQHWVDATWPSALPAGHPYTQPPVLFEKISPEQLAAFIHEFGGAETAVAA